MTVIRLEGDGLAFAAKELDSTRRFNRATHTSSGGNVFHITGKHSGNGVGSRHMVKGIVVDITIIHPINKH